MDFLVFEFGRSAVKPSIVDFHSETTDFSTVCIITIASVDNLKLQAINNDTGKRL